MTGITPGARHRWTRIPPAAFLVLALGVMPGTAHADCPDGGLCLSPAAIRQCDADQSTLAQLRVELRVAEQRLALAAGDALVLSRALRAESAVVVDLRRELRAARPWLPGYAWALIGGVLGIAASVVLALAL